MKLPASAICKLSTPGRPTCKPWSTACLSWPSWAPASTLSTPNRCPCARQWTPILADCDREGLTLDSTAVGDSTVTADRKLLGRILHNLIDNSCKYGATAPRCKSTQPDDLADLGPDAWLTVRHRQRPRKFGHAAPGAEYGNLPACRLCVGRYRAAGAGKCKNDDGT